MWAYKAFFTVLLRPKCSWCEFLSSCCAYSVWTFVSKFGVERRWLTDYIFLYISGSENYLRYFGNHVSLGLRTLQLHRICFQLSNNVK